jgi:hypothetical protein
LNEKRLTNRLQLATTRLEAAQQEHIWAIASAHCEGLSMRRIGEAAGLSSSRVHQLLHSQEACRIPEWLSSLSDPPVNENEHLTNPESQSMIRFQQRIAAESEVLRWWIDGLEQLNHGETVVVNLRATSDPKTAYVRVDRQWVLRVIKRIAAELDRWSGGPASPEEDNAEVDPFRAGVKHRQRLGEPEPELSSLSQREQRAIVREKMGLSPL